MLSGADRKNERARRADAPSTRRLALTPRATCATTASNAVDTTTRRIKIAADTRRNRGMRANVLVRLPGAGQRQPRAELRHPECVDAGEAIEGVDASPAQPSRARYKTARGYKAAGRRAWVCTRCGKPVDQEPG